jgi:osmotically-inducible protein OsmY
MNQRSERLAPSQYEGQASTSSVPLNAEQCSDERLQREIAARLTESSHIDATGVTVQVLGAKVILDGTVPDRYMRHAIEDLADAAPGVQDIENRIRVTGPGATAPTP